MGMVLIGQLFPSPCRVAEIAQVVHCSRRKPLSTYWYDIRLPRNCSDLVRGVPF